MHLKVFLILKKPYKLSLLGKFIKKQRKPKKPKKQKKQKKTKKNEKPKKTKKNKKKQRNPLGWVLKKHTFFPTMPAGRAPRPSADYQPRGRRRTVRRKRVPQSQLIAQLGLAALIRHEAFTGSFFTH
jgi:hypothetical protein